MILRSAKKRKDRRLQAGFTLAEVVIAVGILGVSFISLYAGMTAGFALTKVSRENLRATQIMVERMEGIRLFNWNQIVASNMIPSTFTTQYYPAVGGGTASGELFSGTMTLTNAVLSPAPSYTTKLRMLTVTVDWQSGDAKRTRSMTTLVGADGLQNYVFHR